jgi:dolichyl-phosphate beta-glucosyltransferase
LATIIVVPCYNEENRLHLASFRKFVRQSRSLQFLFVNDGSTDSTAAILDEFVAENRRDFCVHHLSRNSGKAEAVRQGMLLGLSRQPSKIGYWDADLATPLDAINRFSEVLDCRPETELVVGTRMPLLGHDIRRTVIRKTLGRCFATLASLMLGVPIYDTQCGAKLFRVTGNTRIFFDRPFVTKWIFDVELLARMKHACGSRQGIIRLLYEFPLEDWEDVAGSKLRARHFVFAIAEMSNIYWRYLRPGAPRYSIPYRTVGDRTPEQDDFVPGSSIVPIRGDQVEPPTRKAA